MKTRTLAKWSAFGAFTGVACALALALFVTLWELVENPGGIFRTTEGWRWDFLLETAASWFLPTVEPLALLGAMLALAAAWLRAHHD